MAWGKISISPGVWFNSGMFQLGRNYIKEPSQFFGSKGMLRGRVSAFYVGLDVSITISGQSILCENTKQSILSDPNLKIMGVDVSLDQQNSTIGSATPTLRYMQNYSIPQIVAVEIEAFSMT